MHRTRLQCATYLWRFADIVLPLGRLNARGADGRRLIAFGSAAMLARRASNGQTGRPLWRRRRPCWPSVTCRYWTLPATASGQRGDTSPAPYNGIQACCSMGIANALIVELWKELPPKGLDVVQYQHALVDPGGRGILGS